MKKLALITTHPIQYYAPLFRLLSKQSSITLKVFYTWGEQSLNKYDPGFMQVVEWDIPTIDGYDYEFLINTSKDPGTHHFRGIINPQAIYRIRKFMPDVILMFGYSNQSHLNIIRHFKGKVPIWFRGDSTMLDNSNSLKKVIRSILLRWVYSYIDKAFYVGTNNKAYFVKNGLKEGDLIFAPHAIENDRFSKDHSKEATLLKQQLGIGDNCIIILFAGKLEKKKNPTLLLKAFLDLKDSLCHLLFVGNGELEDELKIISKPYSDRIHFMDFQNQKVMPVIYQTCDLFCLPSSGPGETWGLAVNEAMASGRAILISDKVGCGIDLVQSGYNGDIFRSDDLDDLVEKLENITNLPLLKEYGTNSKEIIRNWSLSKIVESIISEANSLN